MTCVDPCGPYRHVGLKLERRRFVHGQEVRVAPEPAAHGDGVRERETRQPSSLVRTAHRFSVASAFDVASDRSPGESSLSQRRSLHWESIRLHRYLLRRDDPGSEGAEQPRHLLDGRTPALLKYCTAGASLSGCNMLWQICLCQKTRPFRYPSAWSRGVTRWFRRGLFVGRPFRLPVPHEPHPAPFSHPAHRTGQADLPHPALGERLTRSPTESCGFGGKAN
jgi:hypothetical protein